MQYTMFALLPAVFIRYGLDQSRLFVIAADKQSTDSFTDEEKYPPTFFFSIPLPCIIQQMYSGSVCK